MGPPYRDEKESLRAEIARLEAELAKRRVAHGRLALLLVAVDFLAVMALRPWLNGPSDAKFWAALAVVIGVAVAAAASAAGFRQKT
jgi:hypothetical protein